MKKLVLTFSLIGLAHVSYGQGAFVSLDNLKNSNPSYSAKSGGLFFLHISSDPPTLMNQDFNLALYGGTDSANLSLMVSLSGAAAVGANAFGPGTFADPSGRSYAVPGTTAASTSAFFRIEAWTGTASSYAEAGQRGGFIGTSQVFSNPVAAPPYTPPDLTGMPGVCIGYLEASYECIPEPSTFVTLGMGAIVVAFCRFRKFQGRADQCHA
jgi:hypothetical protein